MDILPNGQPAPLPTNPEQLPSDTPEPIPTDPDKDPAAP